VEQGWRSAVVELARVDDVDVEAEGPGDLLEDLVWVRNHSRPVLLPVVRLWSAASSRRWKAASAGAAEAPLVRQLGTDLLLVLMCPQLARPACPVTLPIAVHRWPDEKSGLSFVGYQRRANSGAGPIADCGNSRNNAALLTIH
jgi:hypothetical protein